MILLRRLVPLLCFLAVGGLPAQGQTPAAAVRPDGSVATPDFADERTERLVERYKAMLAANPVEGLAMDRLWKFYEDAGTTGVLIEEYHQVAEAATRDAAPSLLYGHFLTRAGRAEEAAAAYDHAASVDPASPLPTLGRAELALARSQPAAAAALFEQALTQLPPADHRRADLLLKTGDAWLAAGQPLKAADDWEKTVALAPGDLNMHRRLADNYEKNGLSERAIGHYEYIEAHADPPGRATALRELGRLHEARGEFDAARESLEHGLALISRDNWLYGDLQTRLIRLYERAGRTPELQARWQKEAADAPRDLGGYLRLELLAETEGDTAGERVWLEKIVALLPRDRESALKLARLLADGGERGAAAARYDALLQSQPGNLDLILARADLDVQMGRQDAAVARVEARLAASPADDSISTPALEFFLAHHLDAASERCLRAQVARSPGAGDPSLALARFLFAARRAGEAHQILEDLGAQPGEAAARASHWLAIADAYKEQNLPDDALRSWQQAELLQPGASAPFVAAGEMLLAHGNIPGAAEQLKRALGLTPVGPEQTEIEHKLFQVLQAGGVAGESGRPEEGVIVTHILPAGSGPTATMTRSLGNLRPSSLARPGGGGPTSSGVRADEPLGKYLAGLQSLAMDHPTAEHFLRLARWQSWAGDTAGAVAAAEKTIVLDAANVPARQLLVTIAGDTHQRGEAERRLREIMALDPSQSTACLRQIAALKAEDNDPDASLEIYAQLQQAAPGSVEASSELALAQQRSDRWYDALATWEHTYALPGLTPAQRADVRRPLLAAYERLGQFPRAAEVLQASVDAQGELSARLDVFHELSAFCRQHDLGGWLEKEYQTRLGRQPNDYFTLVAMAALNRDAGREREAYALLKRSYYSSPDPAASLRALADEAEELGESDEAIAHERRLTTLPGQGTAENLGRLAGFQVANLDDEGAAHTWEQIVARFPRDPDSLGHAAEFFEGAGKDGRARELLRQVIMLDANNSRRRFHLARLDLDAGDQAEARTLLEGLLERTGPEKPGDPLFPPPELAFDTGTTASSLAGVTGMRARALGLLPTAAAPVESDERHLRLDAIRDLTRLLSTAGSDADRQSWLDHWSGAAVAGLRSEPLAAFFYAGQKTLTMNLVGGWLKADPDDEGARNTFLAAGLRLAEYPPLAQWVWRDADVSRRAERGQWLLGALQQYLNAGGKPGPGMVADLFPSEVRLRDTLWEVATTAFADHHWYPQAAELGTRVYALGPVARSEYALKIAEWELNVGNVGHARAILLDAARSDHGDSYETSGNAVFSALRAYVLLLPEGERAAFANVYLDGLRRQGEPAQAVLAALLLHGLAGDTRATERDVDDLLRLRLLSTMTAGGSPDTRRWTFVLNNGEQLAAWTLDAAAAYYWRHALKETSAFERRDADALGCQSEIRGRLLGQDVAMAADPQQAQQAVADYLRAGVTPDAVAGTAAQLLSASQFPAAARLYDWLCRARPAEAENWRNLCICYESAGDRAALEKTLADLFAGTIPLPAGMNRFEVAVRLALLRQADGDNVGACRLLEHAPPEIDNVQLALTQLAQAEEKAGRWEMAARVWSEMLPSERSGSTALSLANARERLGQTDAAVTLLADVVRTAPEPARSNAALRLARLYVSAGRMDDARALATHLSQEGPSDTLPTVAQVLAAAGQRPFARELLAATVLRTHDPRARYDAQRELVAQYALKGEDLAPFTREMRRLDRFAATDAGLHGSFVQDRYNLARQCGADEWLETELRRAWDDSKGDLAAGEQLAAMYLRDGRSDRLAGVIAAIDHHPDLPEQMLRGLEEQLVKGKQGVLALPMLDRLRRRFPDNERYAQNQARALWQTGRRDEASGVLETLDAASVFRDDLVGQAGFVYQDLGDPERARQKFEAVALHDSPAAHYPTVESALAALDLQNHRPADARRWLKLAYRNPTCVDFAPLLNYLDASGQLASGSEGRTPGGDFALTFPRRARLLADLYARLAAAGRPADARRWVESHPELLAGAPGLVARMCHDLPPQDLAAFGTLVESAVAQADPPSPRLNRELAALDVQCASQQTADPAGALNYLARAHDLEPDNFDVAEQLAEVCLTHNQAARAVQALAGFLGPEALPSERARARKTLEKSSSNPSSGG